MIAKLQNAYGNHAVFNLSFPAFLNPLLLHLIQWWGDWAGPLPAQAPRHYTVTYQI